MIYHTKNVISQQEAFEFWTNWFRVQRTHFYIVRNMKEGKGFLQKMTSDKGGRYYERNVFKSDIDSR